MREGEVEDSGGVGMYLLRYGRRRSPPSLAARRSLWHQNRHSYGTNVPVTQRTHGDEVEFDEDLPAIEIYPERRTHLAYRLLRGSGVLLLFGLVVCALISRRAAENWDETAVRGISAAETQPNLVAKSYLDALGVRTLTLRATNEYGEYDRAALFMYGLEMLVEPFRETTITAYESSDDEDETTDEVLSVHGRRTIIHKPRRSVGDGSPAYVWKIVEADGSGMPLLDTEQANAFIGESSVSVTLPRAGGKYTVSVEKRNSAGSLVAVGTAIISCKYVRREIRDLTETDRQELFRAMQEYYTVSNEEGREKYGPFFNNYMIPTAYHNAARDIYCYHAGTQFLTAHAAFSRMMEASLQIINPRVSIPSWDYMIDADNLGSQWHESPIFGEDMFGPSVTSSENMFQVSEGWVATVSSIYDPNDTVLGGLFNVNHNSFGYVNSKYNYQDLPGLTRTSSYCGLESNVTFAVADDVFDCFESNNNINDWESCMEKHVHGDMHGLLGGAFDCNINFAEYQEEHPEYSTGLLTFLLEYMTTNYWPDNSFMEDYNQCDMTCERGSLERCGCTCLLDANAIPDSEVYSFMHVFMKKASGRHGGSQYISYDSNATYPWGFLKDGKRMDEELGLQLMRVLVRVGCEPRSVGYMSGGASPMDPIFFVLHQMFEKALHILWLSPRWRDSYDFEWKDGTCKGSGFDDELPFTERILGLGNGRSYLTNREIMELIHPSNPNLPYVYNNFKSWGSRSDWDPCEECSAAALGKGDT